MKTLSAATQFHTCAVCSFGAASEVSATCASRWGSKCVSAAASNQTQLLHLTTQHLLPSQVSSLPSSSPCLWTHSRSPRLERGPSIRGDLCVGRRRMDEPPRLGGFRSRWSSQDQPLACHDSSCIFDSEDKKSLIEF